MASAKRLTEQQRRDRAMTLAQAILQTDADSEPSHAELMADYEKTGGDTPTITIDAEKFQEWVHLAQEVHTGRSTGKAGA